MSRFLRELVPGAVLALGIVAGQAAQAAWSDLAGTAALAVCVLLADAIAARASGPGFRPSAAAWIMAIACCVSGALGGLRAPGHTASLLPLLGLGAWVALFLPRSAGRRGTRSCGGAPCSLS